MYTTSNDNKINELKKELLFYYTNLVIGATPENANQWIESQIQANIQNLDNAITTYKNVNECIKQLKIYCELNYPNATEQEVKNFINQQIQNQDFVNLTQQYKEGNIKKLDELQQQQINEINELRVKYDLSYKIYVQRSAFYPKGQSIVEPIESKLNSYNNHKQEYKLYLDYENVLNDYFKQFNIQEQDLNNAVFLKMQEALKDNNFITPKYEHDENDIEQVEYNISEKYQNLIKFSNFLKQNENVDVNIYYQTCANTGLALDSLMYHNIENWNEYFLCLGSLNLNEQQKLNIMNNVINVYFSGCSEQLQNCMKLGEEIKNYGINIEKYNVDSVFDYIKEQSKMYNISHSKLFDVFKKSVEQSQNITEYSKNCLIRDIEYIKNKPIDSPVYIILQPLQIKTEEIATTIEQKDTIIEQQKEEILSLKLLRENGYTINEEYKKIFNNCKSNRDFFEKLGEYNDKNVFKKNGQDVKNEQIKDFLLQQNRQYFDVRMLEAKYKQGIKKTTQVIQR